MVFITLLTNMILQVGVSALTTRAIPGEAPVRSEAGTSHKLHNYKLLEETCQSQTILSYGLLYPRTT